MSSPISLLWHNITTNVKNMHLHQEVVIKYVCYSYNNVQDLLISSRLNDLKNYYRCFNIDIMMLHISVRDQATKLKFNSYVHLPSINKIIQYRYA